MTIEFILLVNKQGQTRLSQYRVFRPVKERVRLEGEIVRRCLSRRDDHCSVLEYDNFKVVYKRYASLFFIVGVDNDENELSVLELIHLVVETFDQYFENVCELDVMFNIEKAHFLIEEIVAEGAIVETNRKNVLGPIELLDRTYS